MIMESRKSKGLIVVPVYYSVSPGDIRRQAGIYEEAFFRHKERYESDEVERWRIVLREAAQLKGLASEDRSESLLVEEIVSGVLSILEMPVLDFSNLVGRYDVYLSFRGMDIRRGFTGHLYSALEQSEVNVFNDHKELPLGGDIKDSYYKAMENSRIAVVVFSQEYASSSWCLNEVANLMENKKSKGQVVLPVFYQVKPSDVRKQRGRYGEVFALHEENHAPFLVKKWRIALEEAASLLGFTLEHGNEAQLVQDIVCAVLSILERSLDDMQFHVPANLVGMDPHLKAVYKLLGMDTGEVRMVALCGMGGIGKPLLPKPSSIKLVNVSNTRPFQQMFARLVRIP